MIAQVIDEKSGCESLFHDNQVINVSEVDKRTSILTWKHSDILKEYGCDYAWVWSSGKSLVECCPDYLKSRFDKVLETLKAHMRTLKTSKVCLDSNCFFDLIPQATMTEYFNLKNKICESISKTEKPKNYDFLKNVHIMLDDISRNEINIDPTNLHDLRFKSEVRSFLNKLDRYERFIYLDMFKSKTGRLTTKKGSFPILNLKKEYRKVLKPNNDLFIELDYNSAEVRVFLSFLGHTNIDEDIHEWNVKNISKDNCTREEMKERFFAWLYNPDSKDFEMEKFYNRDSLKKKYWDGKKVENPFGRVLDSDERHCINYLIQSTTNDIVLENAIKIKKLLRDKKSYISFTLHDSVILDFSKEDKQMIDGIVKSFSDTRMGKFKVNVAMGKNFGEMNSI